MVNKPVVLLCRSETDNTRWQTLLEPAVSCVSFSLLHTVVCPPEEISASDAETLLLTSRHAVEALADSRLLSRLPVAVVGHETRQRVEQAGGRVQWQAATVRDLCPALQDRRVLYCRGTVVREGLASLGLTGREVIVYTVLGRWTLPRDVQALLAADVPVLVPFFSVQQVQHWQRVTADVPMLNVTPVAISPVVAKVLACDTTMTAATPDKAGMLAALASAREQCQNLFP